MISITSIVQLSIYFFPCHSSIITYSLTPKFVFFVSTLDQWLIISNRIFGVCPFLFAINFWHQLSIYTKVCFFNFSFLISAPKSAFRSSLGQWLIMGQPKV